MTFDEWYRTEGAALSYGPQSASKEALRAAWNAAVQATREVKPRPEPVHLRRGP